MIPYAPMRHLIVLVAIVFGTTLLLALGTDYVGGHSRTVLFGYPLVAYGNGAVGIIALGQANVWGVIVIAQFGGGAVALTQIGFGLLFGVSQLSAGLITIAQGGVGLLGFLGQIGAGSVAAGQGVIGYAGAGGAISRKGASYVRELADELGEVLALRRSA